VGGVSSLEQAADLGRVGLLDDTLLGEERAYERGGGDVESGIGHRHALGGPAHVGVTRNFRSAALLDGDRVAVSVFRSIVESGAAT